MTFLMPQARLCGFVAAARHMKRRYDLDWLRVIAFALLMLFHTGMLFSTWSWHVKNLETSDYFDYVMRFLHSWRMPLLFFISGSAVWFAMDKFSAGRYFLERQKRLLLPLVFGMLVIIPPQVYFERLYQQQHYDSFLDFYRTIFTSGSYPQGNLSWHHLWYVPYIWAYSMLLFPVFIWLRSSKGRSFLAVMGRWLQRPGVVFLLFVPSALIEVALRPFWPGDACNLIADWGNFTHKLSFFMIGFILASSEGVYDVLARQRKALVIAGMISFTLLTPFWYTQIRLPAWTTIPYRFLANFQIWMWILAALGFGRRYLSFNHPVLRYANEAVYPFYILHQTVIILLGYFLVRMNVGIPLTFVLTATATFFICSLIYAVLIRPWNPIRVLFGMGAKPSGARTEKLGSTGERERAPMLSGLTKVGGLVGLVAAFVFLVASGCSAKRGTIGWYTVPAPSLAGNEMGVSPQQPLAVYRPPSYAEEPSRRFPVVYWLPNFNTLAWRYTGATFQGFRLKESMDRLIKAGTLPPMIVVIPNAANSLGGSWYHNNQLTGRWEDYIAGDLVAYVDSHFSTIAKPKGRALAGHGMGGLGALNLGLSHPEIFGSVCAVSPAALDHDGLKASGLLAGKSLAAFNSLVETWRPLDLGEQKRLLREYAQVRLNSYSRNEQFQGVLISCAAAFACDPGLPFPHLPLSVDPEGHPQEKLATALEKGMGDWESKLARHAAQKAQAQRFIIEYGRHDEYEWIRRGAEHMSTLLRGQGIACDLQVSEGRHDNTLGRRLETAILPAIGAALKQQE